MVRRTSAPVLALAGGFLAFAAPALAQEGVLFQNLMQGVIGSSSRPDIDYRERPPLVVPPSSQLPRPTESASQRNAAWPNDPDVGRRRAAANDRPIPASDHERYRNNPRLSQEELRRGRTSRDAGRPVIAEEHGNYNNQIGPIRIGREMAARQSARDADAVVYGAEPPRRTLAEPPVGYRAPAGTAAVGPGRSGPVEDRQAVGQREFLTGQTPMIQQ